MKKVDHKMEEWLNERRENFLNNGQSLFNSIKEEFNVDTNEAR